MRCCLSVHLKIKTDLIMNSYYTSIRSNSTNMEITLPRSLFKVANGMFTVF